MLQRQTFLQKFSCSHKAICPRDVSQFAGVICHHDVTCYLWLVAWRVRTLTVLWSNLRKCLPVNPGVRAAIFLATVSRFRSVFRGFRWTLKMEYLDLKEQKNYYSQLLFSSLTTTLLSGGWVPRVSRGWHNRATQPWAPTRRQNRKPSHWKYQRKQLGKGIGCWGGGGQEKTWLKKSTVSKHHCSQHMNDTSNELSSIKHLSMPIQTNNWPPAPRVFVYMYLTWILLKFSF